MVKHLLFLRWWLVAAVIGITAYFLTQFGVCQEVWETDSTYISSAIIAVFAVMSVWCGIKTFTLSNAVHKFEDVAGGQYKKKAVYDQIEKQEQIGWFAADSFMTAGFVGTIWGMIVALGGFEGINPSDVSSIQSLISSLVHGVSIALYTTLTGLVCALLLKIQYFNLSYARQKTEDKNE